MRPIHSAVAVGDHASVRALLEAGADPNVRQQGGYTPLHTPAHNDDRARDCCSSTAQTPTLPRDDGGTRALLSP